VATIETDATTPTVHSDQKDACFALFVILGAIERRETRNIG
jgi:hypothetical protein